MNIFAKDTLKMILPYKETAIFYTDAGSGDPVILLHGFLEDHTMWNDIIVELIKTHRVISIDLLGHGNTGNIGTVHTMKTMADTVKFVLEHLDIHSAIFIGHSMGGYVALAFAKEYHECVLGLCLMNSTFEADDEERKELRARANKMVEENFTNMVRVSFANLFSEKSKSIFKVAFEAALQIALKTSVQGYIAAQEGMSQREDLTSFFINGLFAKAILLGRKDTVLDSESLLRCTQKHSISSALFTEGHMSHIENKPECINRIVHFVENI